MKDVFSGDNGGDTVVLTLIRWEGIRDCFVFAFLSLQRLEGFRRMVEIRLNEGSSFAKSRKLFDIFAMISFVSEKK